MEEIWLKLFSTVAGGIIIAFIIGVVVFRDKVRDHEKKLQDDSDDIKKICDQLKGLKEKYDDDRKEYHGLKTIATSVDVKIDAKLKDVMVELAEQRREDAERFTKVITDLAADMTKSVNGLDITLTKVNAALEYMTRDIDTIKKNQDKKA